ncbi:hypothetical protein FBF27_03530 [Candidatus Saccharibacteria bacterium oral taxon 488]|nr:hypothetical protein FBF27_03530 [Candidatus Saccharibacteria bacterium oral taxon 488]
MVQSNIEFSSYGNEVKERSLNPNSIEELVASGFIDESGQLTERTRRAIPRGGVKVLAPVQTQKGEEPTNLDLDLLNKIQKPYRVVADGVLLGGCLNSIWYMQTDGCKDRIFRNYIIICQDPTLVDIAGQLNDVTQKDQHTKLTLRDIGALGLGSFVAGGGALLLSSGEPLLTTAGAVVGGAMGAVGAQLTEKKWFEEQVTRFSQAIYNCPDNIIIDLDRINEELERRTLWWAAGSDWSSLIRKINPNHTDLDYWDLDLRKINVRDIWFMFSTPQYSPAALTFADKYQEYQKTCDAIQYERVARGVRRDMGMTTDFSELETQQAHADRFLSTALLQLFDDVRELGQKEQSRREFDATIERLTTVTEEEIKYQPAKVFHDELMWSLSGETLIGFSGGEQDVYTPAIIWAMDFIHKLPRMITPSLSVYEAYDHFQGEIKVMTDGKLTLPTTEEFQQKYPVIDQGIV